MTLNDFLLKYKVGNSYGYNGTYVGQCVSLVKNYIKEVLGTSPQSIGDAKYYWLKRNSSYIQSIFIPIANTPSFIPKAGDVFVRTSGTYGHIGIVLKATTDYFYTIEQNYNGCKVVKNIKHTDWNYINFLRPKNQKNITTTNSKPNVSKGSFPIPVNWKNGSTKEIVYKQNNFKEEIGSLSAKETAKCYSRAGNAYVVVYVLNGTNKHKVGFVKYAGGVSKAPPESKTWTNGSTLETVYADTAKKTKVGSINPKGQAYCLGKIDGMYLVLYRVSGSNIQKTGFVEYNGGCN